MDEILDRISSQASHRRFSFVMPGWPGLALRPLLCHGSCGPPGFPVGPVRPV